MATRKSEISFQVPAKIKKAIKQMKSGPKKLRVVKVIGRVKKGGGVEIDYTTLAQVSRRAQGSKKSPAAKIAFVALNAPFKTKVLAEPR